MVRVYYCYGQTKYRIPIFRYIDFTIKLYCHCKKYYDTTP